MACATADETSTTTIEDVQGRADNRRVPIGRLILKLGLGRSPMKAR